MALTKYEEGSLRELLSMAVPLMLSSFSMMFMIFVDRLLLAHYSTTALNATVNASTLGWAILFGWVALANITEVFVAQYHGAKQWKRMGEPVWQMLWLALISSAFFIPMAIWGGEWIYGSAPESEMKRSYIRWMFFFGPTFVAYSALSGFFIGQGKTRIITLLAIGANVVNALLDVALIFGFKDIIPSLGVEGAAIATSMGSLFQMIVLFCFFFKSENRKSFGTGICTFCRKSFWKCFIVGAPGALFVLLEILGWAVFYDMMAVVSEDHITVAGICQSLAFLLFFFGEGISKATIGIVGNLIGAKRTQLIPNVLKSGMKIHILFLFAILFLFSLFQQIFIDQFISHASHEYIASIENTLINCLYVTLIYIFFEGVRWLLSGILIAAGDTTFLLIAGSLCIWLFMVAPVYFIVVKMQASVEVGIYFWLFFSVVSIAIYYWRYASDLWGNKTLVEIGM